MNISAATTVAFSGNRTIIIPSEYSADEFEELVRKELLANIKGLYDEGFRTFLSGGAIGFDLIAAEEVLRFKESHSDVSLVIVIPFDDHDKKYSDEDKQRYGRVKILSDSVIVINQEGYSLAAYHMRNDFLVNNCNHLIAYSNGHGRGTISTINKALKRGVMVTNLYDTLLGRELTEQLNFAF